MPKCGLCGKFNKELKKLFDRMACPNCIEEFEEGSDIHELYSITRRWGKEWVRERLEELVSVKKVV